MTGYRVKLSLQTRRDSADWVVWCPVIDVATQARTKKQALENLREAVELWFESCVSRGVLDQALQESGFRKVSSATDTQNARNCVTVRTRQTPDQAVSITDTIRFQIPKDHGDNCLEGFMPALLAEGELGSFNRASV